MSLTSLIHEYSQDLFKGGKINYIARNPTFGTGIAINADPTAIAATEGTLVLANTAAGTSNQVVVPKLIRLTCTAAGSNATSVRLLFSIDKINRYVSGGTALAARTPLAKAGATQPVAVGAAYFGDLTLAAASAAKEIDGILVKTASAPCFTVGDSYSFEFEGLVAQAGMIDSVVHRSFRVASVQLGPGYSLFVQALCPSKSAAASFEVHIEWMELYHTNL